MNKTADLKIKIRSINKEIERINQDLNFIESEEISINLSCKLNKSHDGLLAERDVLLENLKRLDREIYFSFLRTEFGFNDGLGSNEQKYNRNQGYTN
jgi:hypothetical protein